MSQWRVVGMETHDAATNMAIDEAVCEAVAQREAPPTVRFYRWSPGAVSIGYFQSLLDEVAVDKCKEAGVDVVRRRTGGGAVYHDFEGEITYSVIAPEAIFPRGIIDSYHVICGWILQSLEHLGIPAEFKPINDIVLGKTLHNGQGADMGTGEQGALRFASCVGKKISGNAQTRRNGVLLQHGTILFTVDVPKMFSLLKVGQEKIADKMIAAVEERVSSLQLVKPELTMDDVYEALLQGFTAGKKWAPGEWTLSEMQRAGQLAEERYSRDEWNGMR